ncbi:AraC family transcriptional regulator [Mesorhizobium sp. B2-4-17]|uniref:helix-turn-helix domain-containing protein n=1 Tax=Mesorhizobium sp. B2-4-17 TaxID=2589932 RepID=UPI00112E26A5|nr:AraC family transcriptional regulator [Mesorhizobium sp. B2-4-17]TPK75282.1 helix-turn-helix transcriptional regulator [Mesorhizobium sp. B2-4-17]
MLMKSSTTKEKLGFFGPRVSEHFGMPGRSIIEFQLDGELGLAATHLSCERHFRDRTGPAPCEDAFSILHQLDELECRSCWLDGHHHSSGRVEAKEVDVLDLRDTPQWQFRGRFEALQFYIPFRALSAFADQYGSRPISTLRWEIGVPDRILGGLSDALIQAAAVASSNQLLIDQLAISLLTHFAEAYGGLDTAATQPGRLAAWQERRAKEIMTMRLASALTIAQVASECRLTPSHFARAFRRSVGVAPHRYLTQLRIGEAKKHLAAQHSSLSDIALICGFGDQSHFTRVFRQFTGVSPGAWRRQVGNNP